MTSEKTVNLVILLIGAVAILGVLMVGILVIMGKSPDVLTSAIAAATGGLAGILAKTDSRPAGAGVQTTENTTAGTTVVANAEPDPNAEQEVAS